MDTSFPLEGTQKVKGPPEPVASVALIDCAGKLIGVDVAHLREIVPDPGPLQPISSSGPGVVGCHPLRGLLMPVIDLAQIFGWPSQAEAAILVVLGYEGGVVAFRAQATRRIVLRQTISLQDMASSGSGMNETVFPKVGLVGEDAVALLDVGALLGLGIPSTRDSRPATRSADIADQYLLFELDGRDFVLPVARVDGTVPEGEVGGPTLISGPCEGSIRRLDLEVPLINPLTATGMRHDLGLPRSAAAIMLRFEGDQRIAIRADRVRDIIQVKRALIAPLPRVLARRPELFVGVVTVAEDTWYHVLDADAFLADPGFRAFASLTRRNGATGTRGPAVTTSGQRGRRGTGLLFRAGGDFALPIEPVEEIVSLPPQAREAGPGVTHLCTVPHRRGLLPIFCLTSLLGGTCSGFGPVAAVVVTRIAGERVGLAVEETLAIERVSFVEHTDGRREGMVERVEGGRTRLFSVVELDDLAGWTG